MTDLEVSEPEIMKLEVFLDEVELVLPQEILTGLVSVSPQIQSPSWSQPGREKTLENVLGPSKDLSSIFLNKYVRTGQ